MPRRKARHCLFLVFLFGGGFFCWKGNYSLFIVHSSFATKAQVCCLVRNAPPSSSSLSEKKRSAVHGVGEEEGWGTDEDGPVLLQDGFLQGGKRVQVWYRPECPLPLFPLPLPWRARCPLLLHSSLLLLTFAKRPGELAGREAARLKGRAPGCGLQPITSSLFTFTSYFYLAPPAGELARRSRD